MGQPLILALDQGTTSTRAILFQADGQPVCDASRPLRQSYPRDGWVEHDAEEIYAACVGVLRDTVETCDRDGADIVALGVTNQRETVVVWDKATGRPIHPAIVWQDRRTAEVCDRLRDEGHEPAVTAATGLLLDPYFSGTKIAWILDNVPGARRRAEAGELLCGTIDCWVIWRLTGKAAHVTDATNASRTSLMDLATRAWRSDLAELFAAPMAALPEIRGCADHLGDSDPALFGASLPIHGSAGDQQAALVGHGALKAGDAKITYGTGAFLVANVGAVPVASTSRLLGTLGYAADGQVAYALEGSIFSAGSAIQWLRDGLKVIGGSHESEPMARSITDNGGVYLVPGFTGLGAPWWEPEARGTIVGLTRDSGPAHIVRAALESLAYQTRDLLDALAKDGAPKLKVLKVDGGVTANAFSMQFVADICDLVVERPAFQEMTALGAAKLAALGVGLIGDLEDHPVEAPARWTPLMQPVERERLLKGWRGAVRAAIIAARPEPA